MDHFKQLYIFAKTLEHGSMSAAAKALNMTASAVSQHIRNLEKHYRIQLLRRSNRSISPTESGKIVWHYAEQLSRLQQQIAQHIQEMQNEPSGNVCLSLPTGYSQLPAFQRVFKRLRADYPNIHLTLKEENQLTDFTQESTDIAIRAVPSPQQPELIVRPLVVWQTYLCASADYLTRQPISEPVDLLHAHWLNHNDEILLQILHDLNLPDQLPKSRTDCPHSSATAKAMAMAGLGVAVLLEGDIQEPLQQNRLQQILPQISLPPRTLYAVTPHRSQSEKIRVVLQILKEAFAAHNHNTI